MLLPAVPKYPDDYPAPRKFVLVISCVDYRLLDDLVRFLDAREPDEPVLPPHVRGGGALLSGRSTTRRSGRCRNAAAPTADRGARHCTRTWRPSSR